MSAELSDRVKVKPKEGYVIVDPVTGYILPATGKEVVYTTFWHQRVLQGDCVLMDEEPPVVTEVPASEHKRAAKSASKKETGGND